MGQPFSRERRLRTARSATLTVLVFIGLLLGSVTRVPGAIPVLYWMLECTECRTRFVVHDCYLVFVGAGPFSFPGQGYEGPPLPERYTCPKGCARPMRVIGSIFNPDDEDMYVQESYARVHMTQAQAAEWRELIRAAGLPKSQEPGARRRPGC